MINSNAGYILMCLFQPCIKPPPLTPQLSRKLSCKDALLVVLLSYSITHEASSCICRRLARGFQLACHGVHAQTSFAPGTLLPSSAPEGVAAASRFDPHTPGILSGRRCLRRCTGHTPSLGTPLPEENSILNVSQNCDRVIAPDQQR